MAKNETGMSIFPGDVRPENKIAGVSKEELEAGNFINSAGTAVGVNLILVGCVDYQFSFEEGHHQSGSVYTVLPPEGAFLPLQEAGSVPRVSLARLAGGETAD